MVEGPSFRIYLETLSGETISLGVKAKTSIKSLKDLIQDATGVPPDRQYLIYASSLLEIDGRTLSDYDIRKASMLKLTLRLRGD